MQKRVHIGCPVWACDQWKGSLFTASAPRREWLRQYSSVFNTVEGNSTFYSLPEISTVQRWAESTESGFRFCLKFPRTISHEKCLVNAEQETGAFLDILRLLQAADRLGPSFLQLGPRFAADSAEILEAYLRRLPDDLPFAVEVRHRSWFDEGANESWLIALLTELHIDWTLFDSRPLYSRPAVTSCERVSQSRKPRTPFRTTVTGGSPLLRLVGRDQAELVQPWIDEWSTIVAGWLREGRTPFLVTHAPDDRFAPLLAERMHEAIRHHVPELEPLPPWPGRTLDTSDSLRQLSLFE